MAKRKNSLKYLSYVLIILIVLLTGALISIIIGSDNNTKMTDKINTNNPVAVFETTEGTFEIELFLEKSPITAGNFKKLVEEGFYDNTKFHRVIEGFMIQGGDPLTKNDSLKKRWGSGGPGYTIEDEHIRGLSNLRGTISMANAGPNSGGSQFFINVANNTNLDWDKAPMQSKHPVFGNVISGMDIVDSIVSVKTTGPDRPIEDIIVLKAYIK